ncbi:MAG: hypothetical protein WDN27_04050 [Candidatus Saccharibacteria bacterium]
MSIIHQEQSAQHPEVTVVSGTVPIRTSAEITDNEPFSVAIVKSGDEPAHTLHSPGVGQTSDWLTERAAHNMAATGSAYGHDVVMSAAPNHQKYANRDLRRDPEAYRDVVKDKSAQRLHGIQDILKNEEILAPDANLTGHSLGGMDTAEMLLRYPDVIARAVAFVDYAGMTAMSEGDILMGLTKSSMPYDHANDLIGLHAGAEWLYDKVRLGSQSMKLVTDNKTNQDIAELLVRRPQLAVTLVASGAGKFQTLQEVYQALSAAEAEEVTERGRQVNLLGRTVVQEGGHRASATKDGAAQEVSVIEHISGGRQLPPITSRITKQ